MAQPAWSLVRAALVTVAVTAAILVAVDTAFESLFPTFVRLRYNFSAAYLSRELAHLRTTQSTIVLGDSTLWGFGVPPRDAAVSLVAQQRPGWVNLAYAGGGPVNSLAMLRIVLASGVRPQTVIFNVNEKQFSSSDSAFKRLYPAVEQLSWPVMPVGDRARLDPSLPTTADARIDRALGEVWHLYGMRADLRDALFGDVDAAHALQNLVKRLSGAAETEAADHVPTPDKFEGTYDLQPLDDTNASFAALTELATLLRDRHIRSYAILAPTNHTLLHDYIDDPAYGDNLRTVEKRLGGLGVTVLDFDHVIPDAEFIDNDHLTVAGNRRLAGLLEAKIKP